MLCKVKDLQGYTIHAADGIIGHAKDFYFDDDTWVVRYLIVETGSWLSRRKVLVSPIAVGELNHTGRALAVSITRDQVKNSPDIDTDKPVSRQHEIQYLKYYGYAHYWGGSEIWGQSAHPGVLSGIVGYTPPAVRPLPAESDSLGAAHGATENRHDDPHLRSCREVIGYHVHANDGEIGHVEDMLVDEETWAIRYIIGNTGNWWLGHKVPIPPQWIHAVSWPDKSVTVDVPQQIVKEAPPYDPMRPIDREQELRIYKHYGRTGYWVKRDA